MRKRLLISVIVISVLTVLLPVSAYAYDGSDVICNIDSFIIGVKSQGAMYVETALGDFTADALKEAGNADIGIVNGGDLLHVLAAGPVTYDTVYDVFTENKPVAVATVTAEDVWEMLEHGVENVVIGEDEKTDTEASAFEGFPQLSGIQTQYDTTAPKGSRVMYLMIGGEPYNRHDRVHTFRLCATKEMLSGGYGYEQFEYEDTGRGLSDCLCSYLKTGSYSASTINNSRIKVLGNKDNPLVPRGVLFMVGLFVCFCSYIISKAKKRVSPDRSLNSYIDMNR